MDCGGIGEGRSLYFFAAPSRPLVMVAAMSAALPSVMNLLPLNAGARPGIPSPLSPWHTPHVSLKKVTSLGSAAAPAPAKVAAARPVAMRVVARIIVLWLRIGDLKTKTPGKWRYPAEGNRALRSTTRLSADSFRKLLLLPGSSCCH